MVAGMDAIAALTMNTTMDQNGILMSVMTTLFASFSFIMLCSDVFLLPHSFLK